MPRPGAQPPPLLFFSTCHCWDFNAKPPRSACIEENTPYPNTCSQLAVFFIVRALKGVYEDCWVRHLHVRFMCLACPHVRVHVRVRVRVCACACMCVRSCVCACMCVCVMHMCHAQACARTRTSLRVIFIWGNLRFPLYENHAAMWFFLLSMTLHSECEVLQVSQALMSRTGRIAHSLLVHTRTYTYRIKYLYLRYKI